jgi:hypothetical protein
MSSTAYMFVSPRDIRKEIERTLDEKPAPSTLDTLYVWASFLFSSLLAYIHEGLKDLREKVAAIRTEVDTLKAAATTHPTTPAQSARMKCQRCHASGHDKSTCRTKDPDTMKKRVAKNNRSRAKATPIIPPAYAALPSPLVYPHGFSGPTTHTAFTALVADATEMRRRTTQSARDKRKARRNPNVTTTNKSLAF